MRSYSSKPFLSGHFLYLHLSLTSLFLSVVLVNAWFLRERELHDWCPWQYQIHSDWNLWCLFTCAALSIWRKSRLGLWAIWLLPMADFVWRVGIIQIQVDLALWQPSWSAGSAQSVGCSLYMLVSNIIEEHETSEKHQGYCKHRPCYSCLIGHLIFVLTLPLAAADSVLIN